MVEQKFIRKEVKGQVVICDHCKHKFDSSSTAFYISCSRCGGKFKNPLYKDKKDYLKSLEGSQ